MIFLTVGSEFPFDRLVAAVDGLIAKSVYTEEIVAQVGHGGYTPQHMPWVATMPHTAYTEHIRESDGVISHAGMGTIIQCLQMEKPLLVMPRLKRHGEVVNDHQAGTARKFEERGSVLVANDVVDLPFKLSQLKGFRPSTWTSSSRENIVDRINQFLEQLKNGRG